MFCVLSFQFCVPSCRLIAAWIGTSALSYLKSFRTLTKFCAVLIEFCWRFLRLHVVIVAASSCKKRLTCGKQFEYVLTAFFKRKILIGPQVCFVHQLDSRPPFRRSSPSRQPRITPTICFSSVCPDTLELKNLLLFLTCSLSMIIVKLKEYF